MSRRILILTFFYPPDLSAGSFRASALVSALRKASGPNVQIDVVTTQPNRYSQHACETRPIEEVDGIRIRRMDLPRQGGGFLGQAKAFLQYALGVNRLAASADYDLVVATSSRLMTAVLGAWIAYRRGARLYLDIRDIFVENLGELFPAVVAKPLSGLFGVLERWAIRRADKVNLVTPGFLGYFQPKYPGQDFSLYSNGVDQPFLERPTDLDASAVANRPLQVLYAGNVGDGQGLHLIVPQLAQRLGRRVHFRIVGAGGRWDALRETVRALGLDNVELMSPVARHQLLGMYHEADVLFLHLNDFKAFERVLPSKLFEYAATGKPIWAGVGGYAADFVKDELDNAAVFPPCNAEKAADCLEQLRMEWVDRGIFAKRYARECIMRDMARDIVSLLATA